MPDGPSLLDELGLEEDEITWMDLALCSGRTRGEGAMELNWFFEDYEADPELAKAMDEVCLSCPVMKECFFDAGKNKDYGLRGAVYFTNGKPDKLRNEHKEPEVWARIKEKLES